MASAKRTQIFMRFPEGRDRALTLSYDDGVEQDIRLIDILDKHGIKATFNLNSGRYAEEGKVAVRSIRRDAMDKLKDMKKKSEITKDDLKNAEKKTQDLTDRFCKEIDTLSAKKEKEIMEI